MESYYTARLDNILSLSAGTTCSPYSLFSLIAAHELGLEMLVEEAESLADGKMHIPKVYEI